MYDEQDRGERRERAGQARRERHLRVIVASQLAYEYWGVALQREARAGGVGIEGDGAVAGDPLLVAVEEYALGSGARVAEYARVSQREARFRMAGAERWRAVEFVSRADGGIEVRYRDDDAPARGGSTPHEHPLYGPMEASR